MRLPPAAARSAGSLRPPPPPPSSAAAAAAGKGAEETASLPLPTAHARLGPTVRKSATSERRVARALDVTGATRRAGAGLRRLTGLNALRAGASRNLLACGWLGAHLSLYPGSPRASFNATLRRSADPPRVGFVGSQDRRPRLAPGPPARSPARSPQPAFSFLEDTWEARFSIESAKVARTFVLALGLPLSPAFESLNQFSS